MSQSRILVAVSSPWASEKQAEVVADLARRLDAEALVVHVAQVRDEDDDESDSRRRGEQTLNLLTDALKQGGVRAEGLMLFSANAAKAIVSTAQARRCTLIIVGATHKGRLKRVFSGDLPSKVLRDATVPVVILPPDWSGTV